jgi:hypothetical protein
MVMSDRMCRIITERRRSVKRIGASDWVCKEESRPVSHKSIYVDNARGLAYTQRTPSQAGEHGMEEVEIRKKHIQAARFDGGRIA